LTQAHKAQPFGFSYQWRATAHNEAQRTIYAHFQPSCANLN
jgi:hypothetical protein